MATEQASSQLLNEFGQSIGMSNLVFNEDGLCLLSFDEYVVVSIRQNPDTGGWTFLGFLGEFSEDMPSGFYRSLLAASFELVDQGGMSIGLDPSSDSVMLLRDYPLEGVNIKTLQQDMAHFVDSCEAVLDRLDEFSGKQEQEETVESTSPTLDNPTQFA